MDGKEGMTGKAEKAGISYILEGIIRNGWNLIIFWSWSLYSHEHIFSAKLYKIKHFGVYFPSPKLKILRILDGFISDG